MGSKDAANENPSIPAPLDGIACGEDIRPHADLPFEQRHPELVDYQPDLTGVSQGADVTHSVPQPLDEDGIDTVTR